MRSSHTITLDPTMNKQSDVMHESCPLSTARMPRAQWTFLVRRRRRRKRRRKRGGGRGGGGEEEEGKEEMKREGWS